MNEKKLAKMYEDAIVELYNASENISGKKLHFKDYSDLISRCYTRQNNYGKYEIVLPFDCFYLDMDKQEEILKKYTDMCRYHYVWPHKVKIPHDPEFDEYIKDVENYENEKKNLSKWFRKKRKEEIIKKYNLVYRSKEAECLSFTVLNVSPNSSKERFDKIKYDYKNNAIASKYTDQIYYFKLLLKNR